MSKTSKCCTCGYEWQTGQDGTHQCSTHLQKTISQLVSRVRLYEDREDKEDVVSLDTFHWHEALDRVETVRGMLEELVYRHPVIGDNSDLLNSYYVAQDALGGLSSKVMCEREKWEEQCKNQ